MLLSYQYYTLQLLRNILQVLNNDAHITVNDVENYVK